MNNYRFWESAFFEDNVLEHAPEFMGVVGGFSSPIVFIHTSTDYLALELSREIEKEKNLRLCEDFEGLVCDL